MLIKVIIKEDVVSANLLRHQQNLNLSKHGRLNSTLKMVIFIQAKFLKLLEKVA